jgi:ATP-binding cassette subfamily B protein
LPYLARQRRLVAAAAAAMLVAVLLRLPMPLLSMTIIDHLVDPAMIPRVHQICGLLVVATLLRSAARLAEIHFVTRFRVRVVEDLKIDMYRHLLRLPLDTFHRTQTGYLLARVSGDVEGVQGLFAGSMLSLVRNGLTLVVGVAMTVSLNVKLALICLSVLPIHVATMHAFNRRIQALMEQNREAHAGMYRYLQDHVSGIAAIKAYVAETHDVRSMGRILAEALRLEYRSSIVGTVSVVVAGLVTAVGPIAVIGIGVQEILAGRLTLGGLVAFNAFLAYVYAPLGELTNVNVAVQNSLACARRVFAFLDQPTEAIHATPTPPAGIPDLAGRDVVFDEVSLRYEDRRDLALDRVSFVAPAGKVTAIVGLSGAGKSSIVKALFRLYPIHGGRVRIGEHDLADLGVDPLRRSVGIVSQEPHLFAGSVRENIRLGRGGAGEQEVVAAARAARAHDFVAALPEGYATRVGERGHLLSGGERQRLELARAFLKNPPILVLDEATSHLDAVSARRIDAALGELFVGRTVLVVTHRLATAVTADHVVMVAGGRVVGAGRHEDVLGHCPQYRAMYRQYARSA